MFEKWAEALKKKSGEVEEIEFADFDKVNTEAEPIPLEEAPAETANASIKASQPDGANNIELKVVHPKEFSEVSTIADYLIDGCTVVLNVELLDPKSTLRMLDFLNGVTYTTDGEIKKVAQTTYIITPHYIDVSGEDK